jgi:hypothetical protein
VLLAVALQKGVHVHTWYPAEEHRRFRVGEELQSINRPLLLATGKWPPQLPRGEKQNGCHNSHLGGNKMVAIATTWREQNGRSKCRVEENKMDARSTTGEESIQRTGLTQRRKQMLQVYKVG